MQGHLFKKQEKSAVKVLKYKIFLCLCSLSLFSPPLPPLPLPLPLSQFLFQVTLNPHRHLRILFCDEVHVVC